LISEADGRELALRGQVESLQATAGGSHNALPRRFSCRRIP
jgi:hypothetical protein